MTTIITMATVAACRYYAKQHKLEEEREKELSKLYRDRVCHILSLTLMT